MKCPKCGRRHDGQKIKGGLSTICTGCRNVAAEEAAHLANRAAGVKRAGGAADTEPAAKPRGRRPK